MDYPDNFVSISEEIFVMGYPYGWYDKVNNLQITRVGHLATPFKVSLCWVNRGLSDEELGKRQNSSNRNQLRSISASFRRP